MTSPNLRADIDDPRTLAAMDQAFAAVWHMPRADDPFQSEMFYAMLDHTTNQCTVMTNEPTTQKARYKTLGNTPRRTRPRHFGLHDWKCLPKL